MLATRDSVSDCITFFVAFHVLTAIDNIYAEGISDFSLKEAVEEPLVFKRKPNSIKFSDRSLINKIYRVIFKVLNFIYNGAYYYFTPFAVNFIPYLDPGLPKVVQH